MDGFTVLDKAAGVTSFKAAASLRRVCGEKKIGHTGTLDPMATGVLPVALGKATRFIDYLPSGEKAYTARLRFGMTTDTLDITGRVLTETPCRVSAAELLSVLPDFTGTVTQVPPMYSALKVEGQRLYDLARQGKEVARQAREVEIKTLTLTGEPVPGEFELRVVCSKGTYIRTLIDDIGRKLGPGAVMTALRRTAANGFTLAQAKTLAEIEENPASALLPVDAPFGCFGAVTVSEKQAKRFLNGGELSLDRLPGFSGAGLTRVYAPAGAFLGLGDAARDAGLLLVKRVYHKD